jgi:hypothetical protein
VFLTILGVARTMDHITNTSIGNRKKKSIGDSEGKENVFAIDLAIIKQPPSFGFDLGINFAINCDSLMYKELLLSLKSPKV